jgi:hypothetical protein
MVGRDRDADARNRSLKDGHMQKTVARRTRTQIHLFTCRILLTAALLSLVSVTSAQVSVGPPSGSRTNGETSDRVPCLPNNVIPAGHTACVGPDGRTWVAPPPARSDASKGVVVAPPPAMGARATSQEPSPPSTPVGMAPTGPTSWSVWWTIGGVGAITALLSAVAALINSIRGRK